MNESVRPSRRAEEIEEAVNNCVSRSHGQQCRLYKRSRDSPTVRPLPSTGPAFRPNNRSHKIRGGLFWAILINRSALFVYLSCVNSGPLVLFFCGPFHRLKRILYCSRWFRSFYTLVNNLIKHIILLDKLRPNKCAGSHLTAENVIYN